MLKKTEKISTGSYDLNKWLYGGYEKGIITMIVGPPGSGKTNFVILAAASQAKKGNKVLFIDTEGGFSIERVKQIVKEDYENVIQNIILLEIRNFEEQKKAIENLKNKIKEGNFELVIIDGMAMLYRLEISQASYEEKDKDKVKLINKQIIEQMKNLSEIARKENLAVIITNQVYQEFLSREDFNKNLEKETYIVGGDLFQYWSKCIIELKKDKGKRKAILLKHRSLAEKEIFFEIKNEGIIKRGII
jgi:DNA repair protein RadB